MCAYDVLGTTLSLAVEASRHNINLGRITRVRTGSGCGVAAEYLYEIYQIVEDGDVTYCGRTRRGVNVRRQEHIRSGRFGADFEMSLVHESGFKMTSKEAQVLEQICYDNIDENKRKNKIRPMSLQKWARTVAVSVITRRR